MDKEFLKSLGFSEKSAEVVSDFLGTRVQSQEKGYNKKSSKTRPIPTNGEND